MEWPYPAEDIPDGYMMSPRYGKLRAFFIHLGEGLYHNFPLCCVLRFSFQAALEDGKIKPIEEGQGAKRGGCYLGNKEDDHVFVPCRVFHHPNVNGEDF